MKCKQYILALPLRHIYLSDYENCRRRTRRCCFFRLLTD